MLQHCYNNIINISLQLFSPYVLHSTQTNTFGYKFKFHGCTESFNTADTDSEFYCTLEAE